MMKKALILIVLMTTTLMAYAQNNIQSSRIKFIKGNGAEYLEKSTFFKNMKPAEIVIFTIT